MSAAPDCLFCRIVSGEIPADVVHSSDSVLAFRDVTPQAPTHILIIPTTHHDNVAEQAQVDPASVGNLITVAGQIAEAEGLPGYRLVVNTGAEGGQSVFHTHLHLLGGRSLNWPPG
jgi:histidine triad (HIT) family protein